MIEHWWLYRKKAVREDTHTFPASGCGMPHTASELLQPFNLRSEVWAKINLFSLKTSLKYFIILINQLIINRQKVQMLHKGICHIDSQRHRVMLLVIEEMKSKTIISSIRLLKKKKRNAHHQLCKNVEQPEPEDTFGAIQWDRPFGNTLDSFYQLNTHPSCSGSPALRVSCKRNKDIGP